MILQVSCSAGKITRGCRKKSPQVTIAAVSAGNWRILTAPAGNLREAFIVRVRANFLKPRNVSFHLVPNTLPEVTNCCLNGKPFKFDSVPKKLDCSLLAFQSVIQKKHNTYGFSTKKKPIFLLNYLPNFFHK